MNQYYIETFKVTGLWGYKNYNLRLHRDVNVIIGPNASGKTTLINILYETLTANIPRLSATKFKEVCIGLKSFDDQKTLTITLTQGVDSFNIDIGDQTFKIPTGVFLTSGQSRELLEMETHALSRRRRLVIQELDSRLKSLVPAVWLPVSRRLPIDEEEEAARRPLHRKPLESVDECLAGLVDKLKSYRLSLNTDLAELRGDFQRHALENILYDKNHDRWVGRPTSAPPSETDKAQLMKAFEDVGFVDRRMESRIDEHFSAAHQAIERLKQGEGELRL